ncbi:putative ER lumen protein-retaining receptor A [Monocercomonoides exilis]|uniref:putative ER lumen protein-retaining receptor A n=1 Tax=Monocercomonoides exilis TaxID=2049356 RepID=UPI003559E5BC|nr:putative ER lumen protein-retaining receptor A [Monocercomonoides exilis]
MLLLYQIYKRKSADGISLKTQIMYLIVFLTRYLDLFWNHAYLYNTIFKILYIATTMITVYLIAIKFKKTYRKELDRFPFQYLLLGAFILCFIFNSNHKKWFEYVYAFSLYVESVSIIPQLVLLVEQSEVSNLTSYYILFLGAYRGLYILNWIVRIITERHYKAWISWVCGIIQTVLYADFFYEFFKAKKMGKKMELPIPE